MSGRKSQQLYWKIAMAVVVMLITRFQCLIVIFINNIDCRSPLKIEYTATEKTPARLAMLFQVARITGFPFRSFDVFATPLCFLFSGLCVRAFWLFVALRNGIWLIRCGSPMAMAKGMGGGNKARTSRWITILFANANKVGLLFNWMG